MPEADNFFLNEMIQISNEQQKVCFFSNKQRVECFARAYDAHTTHRLFDYSAQ